uniref:Uncharacterized protein n=1 Tax=Megaselia scalaris TaxID=36166 RepID=T1GSX0_MEGSC
MKSARIKTNENILTNQKKVLAYADDIDIIGRAKRERHHIRGQAKNHALQQLSIWLEQTNTFKTNISENQNEALPPANYASFTLWGILPRIFYSKEDNQFTSHSIQFNILLLYFKTLDRNTN